MNIQDYHGQHPLTEQFVQGWLSHAAGRKLGANPYPTLMAGFPELNPEWSAWRLGWQERHKMMNA